MQENAFSPARGEIAGRDVAANRLTPRMGAGEGLPRTSRTKSGLGRRPPYGLRGDLALDAFRQADRLFVTGQRLGFCTGREAGEAHGLDEPPSVVFIGAGEVHKSLYG